MTKVLFKYNQFDDNLITRLNTKKGFNTERFPILRTLFCI